ASIGWFTHSSQRASATLTHQPYSPPVSFIEHRRTLLGGGPTDNKLQGALRMKTVTKMFTALLTVAAMAIVAAPVSAQVQVDPNLPDYTPVQGVSGSLKSVG